MYHSDFGLDSATQKSVFSTLGLVTSVVQIVALIPVLLIADKIPLKVLLPLEFIICGLSQGLFYFIKDPTEWYSFVIWGL